MNKTDLINAAAVEGVTKAQAKASVENVLKAVEAALAAGESVQVVGFGTLSVKDVPARQGINPATKEKIEIAAKKVVKFKAGAELAAAVK